MKYCNLKDKFRLNLRILILLRYLALISVGLIIFLTENEMRILKYRMPKQLTVSKNMHLFKYISIFLYLRIDYIILFHHYVSSVFVAFGVLIAMSVTSPQHTELELRYSQSGPRSIRLSHRQKKDPNKVIGSDLSVQKPGSDLL